MGDGSIQPFIQPITIDTMLNNNGLSIGHGLNSLREQTFNVKDNWQIHWIILAISHTSPHLSKCLLTSESCYKKRQPRMQKPN